MQTALNWANTYMCLQHVMDGYCQTDFSNFLESFYSWILLGYWSGGAIHTGRPMFPCALKNSGRSRIRTDFVNPFAPCIDLYLNKIRAHLYTAVETFLVLGAAPAGGGVVRLFSSSPASTGTSRMICCSDAMCLEKSSPSLHLLIQSRQKYQ